MPVINELLVFFIGHLFVLGFLSVGILSGRLVIFLAFLVAISDAHDDEDNDQYNHQDGDDVEQPFGFLTLRRRF